MNFKCPWCGADMIEPSDEELPKYGIKITSPNHARILVCPNCIERTEND